VVARQELERRVSTATTPGRESWNLEDLYESPGAFDA
jgi:hypothetical protein